MDSSIVNSAIVKLNNTSSRDVYGINSKDLKLASPIISPVLSDLINKCFTNGLFPNCLKLSRIVPIFKKGLRNDPNNYRPIAISPTLSKIIEIIVKERLEKFFDDQNIFYERQYGFRKLHSTNKALIRVINDILTSYKDSCNVNITLCDLTKAFDSVPHDILIRKLEFYGCRGIVKEFFKSYLSNRYQKVSVLKDESQYREMHCGVPQGSILGPLLFIIYINDLPNQIINSHLYLYADDTSFITVHNDVNKLQELAAKTLEKASDWFSCNKLLLNKGKTQQCIFRYCGSSSTNFVKFLGLYINDDMKWKEHINYVSNRLTTIIFLLRKISTCVSESVIKNVYFGLFHSVLSYGILLWGAAPDAARIFKLQKRAMRTIARKKSTEHCAPLFKRFNILTLHSLYVYENLMYVKQNLESFETANQVHSHSTRSCTDIRVPFYKNNKLINGPNFWAPKFYNHLPDSIKALPLNTFKNKIKIVLQNMCLYNFEDFFSCNV